MVLAAGKVAVVASNFILLTPFVSRARQICGWLSWMQSGSGPQSREATPSDQPPFEVLAAGNVAAVASNFILLTPFTRQGISKGDLSLSYLVTNLQATHHFG